MTKTLKEYDIVIKKCKEIFTKKLEDYGTSWRVLRPCAVTDQIFIKTQRIRNIQEKKNQVIEDSIVDEFIGIINYSIIGLIQLELGWSDNSNFSKNDAEAFFDKYVIEAKELMQNKNQDYGEAWRDMRIESFTDIILMRIFRIKQIEDNQGQTKFSEGIASNYKDIINYAVFALIKLTL